MTIEERWAEIIEQCAVGEFLLDMQTERLNAWREVFGVGASQRFSAVRDMRQKAEGKDEREQNRTAPGTKGSHYA